QTPQLRCVEAVRLAHAREVLADARPFVLPCADADVDVVALRAHPAVAAREVGELDDSTVCVAVALDDAVRDVSLVRDAVHDAAPEPERLGRRAVGAIRT